MADTSTNFQDEVLDGCGVCKYNIQSVIFKKDTSCHQRDCKYTHLESQFQIDLFKQVAYCNVNLKNPRGDREFYYPNFSELPLKLKKHNEIMEKLIAKADSMKLDGID